MASQKKSQSSRSGRRASASAPSAPAAPEKKSPKNIWLAVAGALLLLLIVISAVVVVFFVLPSSSSQSDDAEKAPETTTLPPTTTTTTMTTTTALEVKEPPIVKGAVWECGVDMVSKTFGEGVLQMKCPELRDEVNSCCYDHDDCYNKQLGQIFCDDTFCACLKRRTAPAPKCHSPVAAGFCEAVRTFGKGAYENAANSLIMANNMVG